MNDEKLIHIDTQWEGCFIMHFSRGFSTLLFMIPRWEEFYIYHIVYLSPSEASTHLPLNSTRLLVKISIIVTVLYPRQPKCLSAMVQG